MTGAQRLVPVEPLWVASREETFCRGSDAITRRHVGNEVGRRRTRMAVLCRREGHDMGRKLRGKRFFRREEGCINC
jgi:hypothetical protein